MNVRLARLVAVVRADFLIRLRRPSTAIAFLLISAIPYLWIPDPSTGRALIVMAGRRALYNSAAIGMGTASIGTLLIGLFGYYVISNAIRRDVLSRCGYVIASTTMRGSEYIIGKFAGNLVFLSVFSFGFMAVSMAMVLVRGESSLEPIVFAKQYLLILPPALMFVSAVAILFESVKWLSGKFGDVLYFFLWMMLMGVVVGAIEKSGREGLLLIDVSGLGVVLQQLRTTYELKGMAIGASEFDPRKAPMIFPGLSLASQWMLPRLAAMVWPMALLLIARLFFHRFDPARIRAGAVAAKGRWIARFNLMAKPVARLVLSPMRFLVDALPRTSLASVAASDALTSFASFPLAVIAVLVFAIVSVATDGIALFRGVLPFAFAGVAVAIADVASREKRAGTSALVFAAPHLRTRFVFWKFLSTLLLAMIFLAVPLARAIALRPQAAFALLVGVLFLSAAATALGIVSATPKTFIVLFLTFWYVVINDKGQTPSFDFAGFQGAATPAVTLAYVAVTIALLAAAFFHHQRELRSRW